MNPKPLSPENRITRYAGLAPVYRLSQAHLDQEFVWALGRCGIETPATRRIERHANQVVKKLGN